MSSANTLREAVDVAVVPALIAAANQIDLTLADGDGPTAADGVLWRRRLRVVALAHRGRERDPDGVTKVAVLGGGVGGITAAFELTATPELRERFDVTVYQLGWRIGGKGASGRNAAAGDRIEEHGLHVWFGFYDNAFRLMRDAYAELGRPPEAPLATFEDAFKACDQLVLYDRQGDGWHAYRFDCPPNFLRPGDPGELPTFWEMAATATRWALGAWRDLRDDRPGLSSSSPPRT